MGYLGYYAGSTGTAIVTGSGSKWTNSNELYVGKSGSGSLTIADGGQISNTSYCYLGYDSDSSGTATITGSGSTWTNSGLFYIGYYGKGIMTIEAGGQVNNTNGCSLGADSGSVGMVTVTGNGSTWTNTGRIGIGNGALTIEAGGKVSASGCSIGNGSVKVTDPAQL